MQIIKKKHEMKGHFSQTGLILLPQSPLHLTQRARMVSGLERFHYVVATSYTGTCKPYHLSRTRVIATACLSSVRLSKNQNR